MKGFSLTARDKLMFTMCLTLILFIGVVAVVTISPIVGLMLILFDFLLAVIIVLSGTTPEAPAENVMIAQHSHVGPTAAVGPQTDATV